VRLHVNRAKGGCEAVHPLRGPELRALRQLQGNSPYVFVTEAGTPVSTVWFLRMVQRTGQAAKLRFLFTRTCCAMPVVTSSPTMDMTPGRWRTTLGIGICNQLPDIRRWLRGDLRTSGKTNSRIKWVRPESAADQSGPHHDRTYCCAPLRSWLRQAYHFC
jgi:hypothetical protein